MTAQPENKEIQARVSLAMKEALDACPSPRLVPFTPGSDGFPGAGAGVGAFFLDILNKTSSNWRGQK